MITRLVGWLLSEYLDLRIDLIVIAVDAAAVTGDALSMSDKRVSEVM